MSSELFNSGSRPVCPLRSASPPSSGRCSRSPRSATWPISPSSPRPRNWDARGGALPVARSAHRKPDFPQKGEIHRSPSCPRATDRIPIVGIPAGVKMHSGLFAVSPQAAAEILVAFLRGELRIGVAEILDLDEEAYRKGEWRVRLFATAKTLVEPQLVSAGKLMVEELSEEAVRAELTTHFSELFEANPDTLFLLGPGSTIQGIASALGIEKTLLGIDAVVGGKTIAKDVNEAAILRLLDRHPKALLVVSPVGGQGFILGRGNPQVSPAVLRRIGTRNVIVVATPSKLVTTPVLRVDTGDPSLDEEFRAREYLFVLVGYRTSKLHPIQR